MTTMLTVTVSLVPSGDPIEMHGEAYQEYVSDFKGDPGPPGPAGPAGPQGEAGIGIPVGGTAGQVLTKVDGTDYNTSWQDAAGDDRAFAVAMAVALG